MKELLLNIGPPDDQEVFRCLGYGMDFQPHREVIDLVREYAMEAAQMSRPQGAFVSFPVTKVDKEGIYTEKGKILSRKLARVAADAEKIAFGLVTAGELFDEQIEASDGLLNACIRDAVGTVLVEDGVSLLLEEIAVDSGLKPSLPFSPGYCDWDLGGQQLLFSAFPPAPLGIRLLRDSLMMIPQKSVSFVTCLGAEMKTENPCRHCTRKKCYMRRSE